MAVYKRPLIQFDLKPECYKLTAVTYTNDFFLLGVTNFFSGWRKDAVNQCLEFIQASL